MSRSDWDALDEALAQAAQSRPVTAGAEDFEIVRKASRMFEDASNAWMERALKAEAALAALTPHDGGTAIDFCDWLKGYFAGCAGKDELTAFEANTIRNTLNDMVFPHAVPTASS